MFSKVTVYIVIVFTIIAAVAVMYNSNLIMEKLGFETRTVVKNNLYKETQNTNVAIDANKKQLLSIAVLKKSHDLTVLSIKNIKENTKKTDTAVSDIIDSKDLKISEVLTTSEVILPLTGNSETAYAANNILDEEVNISSAISKIQIEAIWQTYCLSNTDDFCQQIA